MELRTDETARGVRERRFALRREGETVPAVIWTPEGADGPRPKVLFGHGGLQDKTAPNIVALARALVRRLGHACVSIDAPGHGERVTTEQRDRARRRALDVDGSVPRYRGETTDPYMPYFLRGVRDWTAVLDAVERLPDVGTGPTGWWGVSMGTSIGLPFVATEPRITCAVLGLASTVPRPGYDDYRGWARSLTVPLLFLCQRHDGGHPVERAMEMFDLFGSTDKTMHVNPGPHVAVPRFERLESERFFERHLGPAGTCRAAGDGPRP
jgi:pimeloyl-ACP methyl ester carboxylesterase